MGLSDKTGYILIDNIMRKTNCQGDNVKKPKTIWLVVVLLSFVFLLSSCGASFSKEKDVFSLEIMRSITADSLTKTFNEKYENPSEDGDTTAWEADAPSLDFMDP